MNNLEVTLKKMFNKLHIKLSDKNIHLFTQIFKFVIVGGIATIIDWIIYYICYNFIHISPFISNVFSFSISVIYNFIASVKWVFVVDEAKSKKRIFIEFIIFSIIGLLISEGLLYLFIKVMNLNEMLSKIIATAIVMVFNFITRKMFLE